MTALLQNCGTKKKASARQTLALSGKEERKD